MEAIAICRHEMAQEIQALMDSVEEELFPGIERVGLDEIPESPDDAWVGLYENGTLKGVLYALKLEGFGGKHNVHVICAKDVRGNRAIQALYLMGDRLFSTPGVTELFAWIPRPWRHVRWVAGAIGLQSIPNSPFVWFINRKEWYASSRNSLNRRSRSQCSVKCTTSLVEK